MTKRLEGKVALVTGGALGIGLETAKRFAAEGARVAIADILTIEGEAAAAGIGDAARFLSLDVTDESAWRSVLGAVDSQYGRLDVLVNNAGISPFGTVQDTPYDLWKKTMAINADSVFLGCKAAMGLMRKSGGGSIVNLSSMVGIRSDANLAAYSASKAAVRLLTKSVALHGAPFKVRCNSVHPGPVQTRLLDDFLGVLPDKREATAMITKQVPLGRLGTPSDIASAILFLASDEAAWVTGSEFCIDGGRSCCECGPDLSRAAFAIRRHVVVMRVQVDRSLCCSYRACRDRCPEVFKHDADGIVYLDQEDVPARLEAQVEEAAAACPQGVICVTREVVPE